MAGFGHLAAEELSKPVMDMLEGHQTLLNRWPCPWDPLEISLNLAPDDMPPAVLDDWLDKVYEINAPDDTGDETGASRKLARFARWEFYPKSTMGSRGKITRMHSLAGLWVKHVAGCAQGLDLASHLVAPDKTVSLSPMEPSRAREILSAMALCLFKGLSRPLPVTAKTGLAYAHALLSQEEGKAKAEALKAYQGDGYKFGGELAYDPCLQRAYPRFDDLWQAHDNDFVFLCQTLYAPLVMALEEEE